MAEMYDEDDMRLAHHQGTNVGQVALAEFVLMSYGHTLDPRLKQLLEKVKQDCFEGMSEVLDKPAEDIALKVENMASKIVKITK